MSPNPHFSCRYRFLDVSTKIFLAVKPQTVLASEPSTLGGVAKDDYVHVVGGDVQGEGVRILQ